MKDNRTSVKRSLLVSAIALALTAALLIGTTFAWFTSTAQTSVSNIQAGILKVEIVDENGTAFGNNTISFVNADKSANVLWEPNATFQTQKFKIKSSGSLALTYKLTLNVPTGDNVLLDNIDFSVVDKDGNAVSLDDFEATLTPDNSISEAYTIKGHMSQDAQNDCQGKTLNGISLAVVAKQAAYEKDSNGSDYDKDATYPAYPAGVTTKSFEDASTPTKTMTAVYEDANGLHYVSDINEAANAGATTIYCKQDSTTRVIGGNGTNRTADIKHDLTIYANGTDFQHGEIAINSNANDRAYDFSVEIHDAKNLYVWGYSPSAGHTQNFVIENCQNVGSSAVASKGRLFYLSNVGSDNGTVNATIKNCTVKNVDSPVYHNADGSMTVSGCKFENCAVPINNNYKSAGTRTDTIENCVFTNCGCTSDMNEGISKYAAPIRYASTGTGTMTVNLTNNTITGTIGTNGDILLGVHHKSDAQSAFTVNLTTAKPVMVKKSADAPASTESGTINVAAVTF